VVLLSYKVLPAWRHEALAKPPSTQAWRVEPTRAGRWKMQLPPGWDGSGEDRLRNGGSLRSFLARVHRTLITARHGGSVKMSQAITGFAVLTTMLLASGASASIGDVARTVDPGIVDVNTNLGYQNSSAAGTGIVLTPSGEILTNNHVIRGATTIRVTDIGNGRSYPATVVGYNVSQDIAVLQLRGASNLPTVAIGDSARAQVGESVAAIGNVGGQGGVPITATGKITGLRRSVTAYDGQGGSEQLRGLIETDATLQPGDSGGPLVDSAGRVIGIDTIGSVGSEVDYGGSSGSGYAIPINRAISLAHDIAAGRSSATTHIGPSPLMGVDIQPNDPSNGGFGGTAPGSGAFVAGVLPSSPADRAGLVVGDLITSADGRTIASPTALTSLLLRKAPGDAMRLDWLDQSGHSNRATIRLATGPPQ
jgi:S1-C subfamily serine protease